MSWWALLAIQKERRLIKRTQDAMQPTVCPYDATTLLREPGALGGLLRCRYCGWRFTGLNNPLQQPSALDQEPSRSDFGPGSGWS